MTTDISRHIEDACADVTKWNSAAVLEVLRVLSSSSPNSQVDWEEGDEEWGRVVQEDVHVALVCARMPLVIAHESLASVASEWAVAHGATVLVIASFDEEVFSVDRSLIERVFKREVSSNVSYELLSINDLWWATV